MVFKFFYISRLPQFTRPHVDVYNPGTERWQQSLTRSCLLSHCEEALKVTPIENSTIVVIWIVISRERAKIMTGVYGPGSTLSDTPRHLEEQIVMSLTGSFARHSSWQALHRHYAGDYRTPLAQSQP